MPILMETLIMFFWLGTAPVSKAQPFLARRGHTLAQAAVGGCFSSFLVAASGSAGVAFALGG